MSTSKKDVPPAKSSSSSLSSFLGKDEKDKDEVVDLPVGPDSNKDDVLVKVDNKKDSDKAAKDTTYNDDRDDKSKPYLSPEVVSLRADKTPAELAAETPDETAKRYNVDTSISDADADNPRVQVYRDTHVNQVPSGTHLHPDVAKDLQNRGISEQHTDNAQVKRSVTEYYDFAPDAEHQDKYVKPADVDDHDNKFDRDEDYDDDDDFIAPSAGSSR